MQIPLHSGLCTSSGGKTSQVRSRGKTELAVMTSTATYDILAQNYYKASLSQKVLD